MTRPSNLSFSKLAGAEVAHPEQTSAEEVIADSGEPFGCELWQIRGS